jgi:hypothetical protein
MWLPPLVELWTDHPNNVSRVWDFFTGPHPATSIGQAWAIAGDALSVLPFGNTDYVLALHRTAPEAAATIVAVLAIALLAVRVARQRHLTYPAALIKAAMTAGLVGAASLELSDGAVYIYFALWLSVIPLAVLVALVSALLPPNRPVAPSRPRAWPTALAALTTVVAVTAVIADLRLPPANHTIGSGPWPAVDSPRNLRGRTPVVTAGFDRAVLSALPSGDHSAVLDIGSPGLWPYAAGIVWSLEQDRVSTAVTPARWNLYFGQASASARRSPVRFGIYPDTSAPATLGAAGHVIAHLDGVIITYQLLG